MNILDVLEVETLRKPAITANNKFKEYNELYNSLISDIEYINKFFGDKIKVLSETVYNDIQIVFNKKAAKLNDIRLELNGSYKYLPKLIENNLSVKYKGEVDRTSYYSDRIVNKKFRLIETPDAYSTTNNLSKAKIGHIKSLADKLGFVIIPYEYYNDVYFDSNGNKSYNIERDVKKSINNTSSHKLRHYILCPLSYYSLEKHIKNAEIPMYLGNNFNIMSGVILQIPILRAFSKRMDNMQSDINNNSNDIMDINQNIEVINTQINTIITQVNDLKEQQILQSIELQKQKERHERELEEMKQEMVFPIDPVLFTLPIDVDVSKNNDNESLTNILYAWGPDFTDEISNALDLGSVTGNRTKIEKTIMKSLSRFDNNN